jgi:anti-sigma regulatory factor (Ser/Thr protein kinase)
MATGWGGILGTVNLTGEAASVTYARSWVKELLGTEHPALDSVLLIVSELVTNSVRHSKSGQGGWITLRITAADGVVHGDVIDAGSESVPRVCRDPEGEGGRGMFLVEQFAQEWGFHDDEAGRVVWFRVKY